MNNLLFESKGMNEKFILKMKISLIISFCVGILMFILINIKIEKTRYFMTINSLSDPLPKYKAHLIANQDDRILFAYIGIVLILSSIIVGIFVFKQWNKIYLKIYDDYIEYFEYREFKYFYNEIKHVDKCNHKLLIYTTNNVGSMRIFINGDIDTAYNIIQSKIQN